MFDEQRCAQTGLHSLTLSRGHNGCTFLIEKSRESFLVVPKNEQFFPELRELEFSAAHERSLNHFRAKPRNNLANREGWTADSRLSSRRNKT